MKIQLLACLILILLSVIISVNIYLMNNNYRKPQIDNNKTNVLFIHHSTGGNLLKDGEVRDLLQKKGPQIALWDHGYNINKNLPKIIAQMTFRTGLSDSLGEMSGIDYNIVVSNNSPKEYADIFSRNSDDATLNQILQYDVVIFKNCFPTSDIESEDQLIKYKEYYIQIKNSLAKYPDKLFIIFTSPPLRSEATKKENAERANQLADWMSSTEFVNGTNNIQVFDFYHLLADKTGDNSNMLKRDYTHVLPFDSHPNEKANKETAPVFVNFLVDSINKFSE